MQLSPLDLRKQQFRKVLRGYDADEVRAYLNEVARQWEEVLDSGHQHDTRVRELEHKLKHYERVELALQEALESARETGRRAESNAEQKAKLIVEEAELRALRIMQDAEQERYALRQDLVKLTHRQNEVAARLRAFLMSELEVLAQFQGDDPIGFIKLVPAGAQEGAAALPPAAQRRLEAAPEAPPEAAQPEAPAAAWPDEEETPSAPAVATATAGSGLGMMAEAFAEPAYEEPAPTAAAEPIDTPVEWAPEPDEPDTVEVAYEEVEPEPEPAPAEATSIEQAPIERAPIERAPIERAPIERAPIERAPIERAYVETPEPAPIERAPIERAPIERAPIEHAQPTPGPVAETPAAPVEADDEPAPAFDFEAWFNSETDERFPDIPSTPPVEADGLPIPGPGRQPEAAPARPPQDAASSGASVWERYRQAEPAPEAAPSAAATAAAALADSPFFRPAAPPPEPGPAPGSDAAQGWSLRSIVTGEAEPPAASEDEREKIRRLLEGLD